MNFGHPTTVTVQRPTKDNYGDITLSDPWLIDGCGVAIGTAASINNAPGFLGDTSKRTLLAPTGSDLAANDRVTINGEEWSVDGDPGDWCSPFSGWRPGMVAELTRGEG